jgi:hypothetical protein
VLRLYRIFPCWPNRRSTEETVANYDVSYPRPHLA